MDKPNRRVDRGKRADQARRRRARKAPGGLLAGILAGYLLLRRRSNRHLIDGINVIRALDAVQISLMNSVNPDVTGLAVRLRSAPLADHYLVPVQRELEKRALSVR